MKEHGVPFGEAMKVWARVAALSFGGPAGQIAVMHRIIVEEKKWIGEQRFLQALNYCTLLPGPEAQQLAIYIGWLMHKTKGGLVAGQVSRIPVPALPRQGTWGSSWSARPIPWPPYSRTTLKPAFSTTDCIA